MSSGAVARSRLKKKVRMCCGVEPWATHVYIRTISSGLTFNWFHEVCIRCAVADDYFRFRCLPPMLSLSHTKHDQSLYGVDINPEVLQVARVGSVKKKRVTLYYLFNQTPSRFLWEAFSHLPINAWNLHMVGIIEDWHQLRTRNVQIEYKEAR